MSEFKESCKSKILISNSTVVTDSFHKTVVLLIEHDRSGAFGLVINRKSTYFLHEVVVGIPDNVSKDIPIYWGGPVDSSFISIVHNGKNFPEPGLKIIDGVYLSRSYDLLIQLLETPDSVFKVFHGYSGWGALQLESEFERKSWAVHGCTEEMILRHDPEAAWKDALISKGGIYKYFAEHTKDPYLN
ncbi:MAG TPA: YqgE/AlgH family protein [Leptospiraceae bacterium]|nr:YqgE/AlgH family protein [Leptospiraceae bacterium]